MEETDYGKEFNQERLAATLLRDELCFLVGFTANDPDLRVINKRLQKALDEHEDRRVQYWF